MNFRVFFLLSPLHLAGNLLWFFVFLSRFLNEIDDDDDWGKNSTIFPMKIGNGQKKILEFLKSEFILFVFTESIFHNLYNIMFVRRTEIHNVFFDIERDWFPMKQQQQESFVNIFSGSPESPESKNQRIKTKYQKTTNIIWQKTKQNFHVFRFLVKALGRIIGWL